jgi:hypothetical protein
VKEREPEERWGLWELLYCADHPPALNSCHARGEYPIEADGQVFTAVSISSRGTSVGVAHTIQLRTSCNVDFETRDGLGILQSESLMHLRRRTASSPPSTSNGSRRRAQIRPIQALVWPLTVTAKGGGPWHSGVKSRGAEYLAWAGN